MRIVLAAALLGGAVASAHAANFDSRLYVSPALGFTVADPGRGADDDFGLSVTVGLPMCDCQNYELDLAYEDLDGTNIYSLNVGVLNYFDRARGLFAVLRGGLLASEGGVGEDYFSPNIAAGLGAMLPGWGGSFRVEALLRGDLHFDEGAGLGGKKAFVEPILRLGYQIPLGPEPRAESPDSGSIGVVATAGDDSDGDGVSDSADLCPGTPTGTVVDSTGCAVQARQGLSDTSRECRAPVLDETVDEHGCAVNRAVVLKNVNFEFDSDILTTEAERVLDDVAQVLKGMPGTVVEIAGHTSDEGDEYYNIDLSQRRAAAVRRYLIDAGVDASRLKARGYGGNAPLTGNDSFSGRRQNRRVEVKVVQQ